MRGQVGENSYFNDKYIETFFFLKDKFSSYQDEKIFLVEEQWKGYGVSTFFYFLLYYQSFLKYSRSIYVSASSSKRDAAKKIVEYTELFKAPTKLECTNQEDFKQIYFTNNSIIKFASDTTYNFRNITDYYDLLIFDNASMKNFDKLVYLLESVLSNLISEKVILNFNQMPSTFKDSENFKHLKKQFKNHLKLITI